MTCWLVPISMATCLHAWLQSVPLQRETNTDVDEQGPLQEVQNETETNKSDKDTRVFHNPVYDAPSEIEVTSPNDNMTPSGRIEATNPRVLTTEDDYAVAYPPPASANQTPVQAEGASTYDLLQPVPAEEGEEGGYDVTVHGQQQMISPQSHDQDESHDKNNYSHIPDGDYDYADVAEPKDTSKEAITAKPQGGDYEDASILMLTTPPSAGTV